MGITAYRVWLEDHKAVPSFVTPPPPIRPHFFCDSPIGEVCLPRSEDRRESIPASDLSTASVAPNLQHSSYQRLLPHVTLHEAYSFLLLDSPWKSSTSARRRSPTDGELPPLLPLAFPGLLLFFPPCPPFSK